MAWANVGGGVASSLVGGLMGGKGKKDSGAKAAQQQSQANLQMQQEANKMNMANTQADTRANRPNQSSDFGSSTWNQDPTTGAWSQTQSIDPQQQGMLNSLRGNQSNLVNGMSTGGINLNGNQDPYKFDVNGDVMNAYKAQQQPMLDQARNHENARLAAMGLSTGSGQAWGNAQDALNRNQNDADQKAILAGFNANQQLNSSNRDLNAQNLAIQQAQQANNRSNLGALNSTEGDWRTNSQMPVFATQKTPAVGAAAAGDVQKGMTADNQQQMANANQAGGTAGQAVNGLMNNWANIFGNGADGSAQPQAQGNGLGTGWGNQQYTPNSWYQPLY